MTFDEWLAHAGVYLQQNGRQRVGQGYFNSLYEHRPDIADRIRGSIFDPFFSDNTDDMQMFFEYVQGTW